MIIKRYFHYGHFVYVVRGGGDKYLICNKSLLYFQYARSNFLNKIINLSEKKQGDIIEGLPIYFNVTVHK